MYARGERVDFSSKPNPEGYTKLESDTNYIFEPR